MVSFKSESLRCEFLRGNCQFCADRKNSLAKQNSPFTIHFFNFQLKKITYLRFVIMNNRTYYYGIFASVLG